MKFKSKREELEMEHPEWRSSSTDEAHTETYMSPAEAADKFPIIKKYWDRRPSALSDVQFGGEG